MAGSKAGGLARASWSNEGRGPPPRAPSAIICSRPLIPIISNIMIISGHRGSWRNIIWEHPLICLNINLGHRDDTFNHRGGCVCPVTRLGGHLRHRWLSRGKKWMVFYLNLHGALARVCVCVFILFSCRPFNSIQIMLLMRSELNMI